MFCFFFPGNSFYIFSALVLFLVGGITIVYTPFSILMNEVST